MANIKGYLLLAIGYCLLDIVYCSPCSGPSGARARSSPYRSPCTCTCSWVARARSGPCRSPCSSPSGARARSGPYRSPCTQPSDARAGSWQWPVPQSLHLSFRRPVACGPSWQLSPAGSVTAPPPSAVRPHHRLNPFASTQIRHQDAKTQPHKLGVGLLLASTFCTSTEYCCLLLLSC
jgi:hypothetical protein